MRGVGAWFEAVVKYRELVAEEGAAVWSRAADAIATPDNIEASSEFH